MPNASTSVPMLSTSSGSTFAGFGGLTNRRSSVCPPSFITGSPSSGTSTSLLQQIGSGVVRYFQYRFRIQYSTVFIYMYKYKYSNTLHYSYFIFLVSAVLGEIDDMVYQKRPRILSRSKCTGLTTGYNIGGLRIIPACYVSFFEV